jgi:hypothetical protein
VVQGCGGSEEPPALLKAEDGRETRFGLGAHERPGVPVALDDVLGEERDAAGADAHGSRGEVVDVFAGQAVVLEVRCGEEVRGWLRALREPAHLTDIGWWGAFARATEWAGGKQVLTQRGHERSPFRR